MQVLKFLVVYSLNIRTNCSADKFSVTSSTNHIIQGGPIKNKQISNYRDFKSLIFYLKFQCLLYTNLGCQDEKIKVTKF